MNISNPSYKCLVQPERIRNLFSQRTFGSIYLSLTLEFLHLLVRLGIRPKTDGWRKYATAFLRSEDSCFLLSLFRLKIGQDVRDNDTHSKTKIWIIENLAHFFGENPQLWNTRLVWSRNGASIQPNNHLDLVWAEFDSGGKLSKIRVFLDVDQGLSPDDSARSYAESFVQAYNQTIFSGRQRPYHLMNNLRAILKNTSQVDAAIEFAQRVLDSVFIHFENITVNQKLNLPDFSEFPHPGGGAFNILCRLQSPDYHEVDLWFHVNHVLQDGNPVLDAINPLKSTWGTTGTMVFPRPDGESNAYAYLQPAYNDSGRELVFAHQQISFEHLLKERERLNQKFRHLIKNKITVAGMILWGLGSQPFLKDEKITLIIDVPPKSSFGEPRTLGFATMKPNDFLDETDKELSFVNYQIFLNDAIELVRKREDLTYLAMKSQALVPVATYEMTLAMVPNAVRDIGGKYSLTIMPRADYCAAPADDAKDAVIAVGNIRMPTSDGKLAGSVCVKSIKEDVNLYWESIYKTVTEWHI